MSARRRLFQVHQTVGLAAALVLLVTALTGGVLTFRESFKAGPPPRAPRVEAPLTLEALIARAEAAGPGDPVTDITLPSAPEDPYQLWLDDDAETVVYLAGDGAVLGTRATAGTWTQWLFKLHTGAIAGTPGELVVFVGGLSLAGLGVTGVWMFAARRRRRPKET